MTITKQHMIDRGADPWSRKDDFADSLDMDAMSALSSEMSDVAWAASDAGADAASGSADTGEAGSVDGQQLHDIQSHVTSTSQDLGNDGDDFKSVAIIVDKIRQMADIKLTAADGRLDVLEEYRQECVEKGQEEINQVKRNMAIGNDKDPDTAVIGPDFECDGKSVNTGADWSVLQGAISNVVEHWRQKAGDRAKEIDDNIKDLQDDYESYLGLQKGELAEFGYDIGDSGVDFGDPKKMNEEDAQRHAEALKRELEKDDPDAARIALYTDVVAAITDDLYDKYGNPVADGSITEDQWRYLYKFYDTLGADGLAKLDGLTSDMAEDGGTELFHGSQRAVLAGARTLANDGFDGVHGLLPPALQAYSEDLAPKAPNGSSTERLAGWDNPPWKVDDPRNKIDGWSPDSERGGIPVDFGGIGNPLFKWDDWAWNGSSPVPHHWDLFGNDLFAEWGASVGPKLQADWGLTANNEGLKGNLGGKFTLAELAGKFTYDTGAADVAGNASGSLTAEANAYGQVDDRGARVGADAFAGGRIGGDVGINMGPLGVTFTGEGLAGAGASAEAGFGQNRQGRWEGGFSAGAALGLGGRAGVGITVDPHKTLDLVGDAREAVTNLF